LHPFLSREAFDVVKAGAADDANFVFRHERFLTAKHLKQKLQIPTSKHQRIYKHQTSSQIILAVWFLKIGASLDIGAWYLELFSWLAFMRKSDMLGVWNCSIKFSKQPLRAAH